MASPYYAPPPLSVTSGHRKAPEEMEKLKYAFQVRICKTVNEHKIPPQLIYNKDETFSAILPHSSRTMHPKGTSRVRGGVEGGGGAGCAMLAAIMVCEGEGRRRSAPL